MLAAVPYYFPDSELPPAPNSDWDALNTVSPDVMPWLIINPKSGPGYGSAFDVGGAIHQAYTKQIAISQGDFGHTMVAYVTTNYHVRTVHSGCTGSQPATPLTASRRLRRIATATSSPSSMACRRALVRSGLRPKARSPQDWRSRLTTSRPFTEWTSRATEVGPRTASAP